MADARVWECRDRVLDLARPCLMGILNVTPDSFSDGGRYLDSQAALAHAAGLIDAGAAIVDVGGESTRPGAAPVAVEEEWRRAGPVIAALAARGDVLVSVDTSKAEIARRALDAGAHIVNDVSALTHDPAMAALVATAGAGVVLMHRQGTPETMQKAPAYDDVVREVRDYLTGRVAAAQAAGIGARRLVIDPGIGFGKTVGHNLRLLANLDELTTIGPPLLVGLSRKRFIGMVAGAEVEARLPGSLAGLVCAVFRGARVLRVHDVAESRQALDLALAIEAQRREAA